MPTPIELPQMALVGGFVLAGGAAGFAVHEPVGADSNVDHRLAQAAEFLALAVIFGLLALRTTKSGGTGSGAHGANVARRISAGKMT